MPITVEIEGKGEVAEFPDGTDQAIIDAAMKRDYFTAPTTQEPYEDPFATTPAAPGVAAFVHGLGAPRRWAEEQLAKVPAFAKPLKVYEPVIDR